MSGISKNAAIGALVVVGLILVAERSGHAQPKPKAVALFEAGRALADKGQFAEACKKFEESNRLDDQAVGTLLNLGLCNEQQQKWSSALIWYRASLERAQASKEQIQIDAANEKILQLSEMVAHVEIQFAVIAADGTKVTIDGRNIDRVKWGRVEVDNGPHTIEIQAPGKKPFVETADLTTKGKKTVQVVFEDYVPPATDTKWKRNAILFGGAGVALWAGAVGSAFLFCGNGFSLDCKNPNYNHNIEIYSTSIAVAGTALVGFAVYYVFFAPKKTTSGTAMIPTIGNDNIGLALTGSF
jgi:tetratricopeptide (TPR) repeat protein